MEPKIKKVVIVITVVMVILLLLMIRCSSEKYKKAAVDPVITVTGTVQPETADEIPVKTPKSAQVKTEKKDKKKKEKPMSKQGYDVNITEKDGEKIFVVKKDGKEVMEKKSGEKAGFKMNVSGENKSIPQAFEDVTGDGKPDFILQQYSEKENCTNVYSIFSVEDDFELMAEIKGLGEGISFKDLDGDKKPELIGSDCTFLNWWASFGDAVAPKVILRYVDGHYELYGDLMRKDPPDASEMKAYADKNKGNFISYVWNYMLDLIYTGNGDSAWEFFNMVQWDDAWEGEMMANEDGVERKTSDKADFLEAFKEQLSTSPYWDDLKELNGWEMDEMMM